MELHDINSLNRNELSEYRELTMQELDKERAFDDFIDCEIDRLKEEEYERRHQSCMFCGKGKADKSIIDDETLTEVLLCEDCFNQTN